MKTHVLLQKEKVKFATLKRDLQNVSSYWLIKRQERNLKCFSRLLLSKAVDVNHAKIYSKSYPKKQTAPVSTFPQAPPANVTCL